jgi:hypothetical protein
LVRLLAEWIKEESESMNVQGLPDDLYSLPELKFDLATVNKGVDGVSLKGNTKKEGKTKWGSVLVEKRSSRNPRDGRTIMEKAQERKKLANLEGPKGNSKYANPFSVLALDEISLVAKVVGVSLGSTVEEIEEPARVVQENGKIRLGLFEGQCD